MTAPLRFRVFKNTGAQIAGRGLIALARLLIAGLIVRALGKEIFGAYSLVFGILAIAEWLVDFGTTETFVREICREPERRPKLLRILTSSRLIQVPVAVVVLAAILLVMGYPREIIEAGLVGGLSLFFFAGILVYRTIFKADLTMEREVTAEFVAVLSMIPMVMVAARMGGGVVLLIACHVASRGVFLLLCFLLGRRSFRPSMKDVERSEVSWGLRLSAPIGTIGFFVAVYEATDLILLSRLGTMSGVGYYSAAQRLVWPMLMALSSIGATLYPVASSYWPQRTADFENACQRGIDTVLLLGGVALTSVLAAAGFFMGLLGPDLVEGQAVLRLLAILCFIKALTSTVGPVLYVVHAQTTVLRFIPVAVVAKIAVMAALIPSFGYMGAAWGALGVEVMFSAIPSVYFLWRHSGYRIRWGVPLKVVLITLISAGTLHLLTASTSVVAAVGAPLLYTVLAFAGGLIQPSEIQSILRWRTSP